VNASPHAQSLQEFKDAIDNVGSKQELEAIMASARDIEGFGILEHEILNRLKSVRLLPNDLPDAPGDIVNTGKREVRPEIIAALEGATGVLPGGRAIWDLPRTIKKLPSVLDNWIYMSEDDKRNKRALADSLGGF